MTGRGEERGGTERKGEERRGKERKSSEEKEGWERRSGTVGILSGSFIQDKFEEIIE